MGWMISVVIDYISGLDDFRILPQKLPTVGIGDPFWKATARDAHSNAVAGPKDIRDGGQLKPELVNLAGLKQNPFFQGFSIAGPQDVAA